MLCPRSKPATQTSPLLSRPRDAEKERHVSRLDSFIRRLTAQRACLDKAVDLVDGRDGVVLEIGLGNGRTYDHLRHRMPDREIFVFDRQVASHPDSTPDEAHLFLGDLSETLARAARDLPDQAVLVHSDIGTGNPFRDAQVARMMAEILPTMLRPGAVVVSDQDIPLAGARDIALPVGVQEKRYFFRAWRDWREPAGRVAGKGRWR